MRVDTKVVVVVVAAASLTVAAAVAAASAASAAVMLSYAFHVHVVCLLSMYSVRVACVCVGRVELVTSRQFTGSRNGSCVYTPHVVYMAHGVHGQYRCRSESIIRHENMNEQGLIRCGS